MLARSGYSSGIRNLTGFLRCLLCCQGDHKVFLFQVEVMMEGIIRAFKDRVSGVGWIDKQTVEAVREKVRA